MCDDPLVRFGGEPAIELTPEEIEKLLAGKLVHIYNDSGVVSSSTNFTVVLEPSNQVLNPNPIKRPEPVVKPTKGPVKVNPQEKMRVPPNGSTGRDPSAWLDQALIKSTPWKVARRKLLQHKEEIDSLRRNIANARVYAIRNVFPGDGPYDPSDPRIDTAEGQLVSRWQGRLDKLVQLTPGLQKAFDELDRKRLSRLNHRHLELWRECFGGLPLLEPELIPEPEEVRIERSGAGYIVTSREVAGGSGGFIFTREATRDSLQDTVCYKEHGKPRSFYDWKRVRQFSAKPVSAGNADPYQRLVNLALVPVWVAMREGLSNEGDSIEIVHWPFVKEWSDKYENDIEGLVQDWLVP
jgi:hypothetical protein